jgi:hypothetical protein
MAGFSDSQRKWIVQFLSTIGQNAASSGLPFDKTAPGPAANVLSGAVNTSASAPPTPPSGYDGPPPNGRPNPSVAEAEVVSAFRANPETIHYSQRTQFHEDIWKYLGNKGPSPIAYRVGDTIRVDIERFPSARLPEIGIHPRTTPITTVRTGGSGPSAPAIEQGDTQQGQAPVDPNAKTGQGEPPAKPAKPANQAKGGTMSDTPMADGGTKGGGGTMGDEAPKVGQRKTPWDARVQKIEPIEALKMSQTGKNVFSSVSGETHQMAWENLGQEGKAPIAYRVDNDVYVDLERWPEDLHRPEKHYPRGTTKVAPQKPNEPVKPQQQSTPASSSDAKSTPEPTATGGATNEAELQKRADEYARRVDQLNAEIEKFNKAKAQGGEAGTEQKLEKQGKALQAEADALAAEAEALATKVVSLPELAGSKGSSIKETMLNLKGRFSGGGVRGTMTGVAMVVVNAYFIVQDLRYIFKADSVIDGLKRGLDVGKNYAKGAIEIELLALITRSTPVAIAITILIGEEDRESDDKKRKRLRALTIANFVNEIAPGSVDTSDNIARVINQKLWDATVNKINQMRKDYSTGEAKKIGYKDGILGRTTDEDKLEPNVDDQDANVTQQDLLIANEAGRKEGVARRKAAVERAKTEGLNDGKSGKPASPEKLQSWYEVKEVETALKGSTGEAKENLYVTSSAYYTAYQQGYEAGHKTFATQDVTSLAIEPQSFSAGAYTTRKLVAMGKYPDGRTIDLTDKVKWKSDKSDVVGVGDRYAVIGTNKGGEVRERQGIQASLDGAGSATVTAEYSSGGRTLSAKITITVTAPKIAISPAAPSAATYTAPGKYMAMVGAKQQFVVAAAAADHWDDLLSTSVAWEVKPPGLISIDQSGNATMVKEGNATIMVTDRKTKATGKIEISVEPAGSLVLGRKLSFSR